MRIVTAILALFTLLAGPASAQVPDGSAKQLSDFNWQTEPKAYKVGSIAASMTTEADEAIVTGTEAGAVMSFLQGIKGYDDVEGLVVKTEGPLANSFVVISHDPIGYVKDDDWSTTDANSLLDSFIEGTEEGNKARAKAGVPLLKVAGWAEPPHYDKVNNTLWWAIRVESTDGQSINATALKLSRNGYSRLIWVGDPAQFTNAADTMRPTLDRYRFDPGHQYGDFSAGDVVAGVGLAGLAVGILKGKAGFKVATGILALALPFLKKFGVFLVIPLLAGFRWLRQRLGKGGSPGV
ncbi:DUF2167 domain-containing protein [Aerophototrophica crusticola]|uniref:DUF2167 domain-containing protein n=1 Tax=Aerophototrophica crusticola TaxID=1709002 RepID=A0A858R3Q8_9PROT|nr:DUF2167 domain-containing protein [Rhodospirillaceae bacterium B3]